MTSAATLEDLLDQMTRDHQCVEAYKTNLLTAGLKVRCPDFTGVVQGLVKLLSIVTRNLAANGGRDVGFGEASFACFLGLSEEGDSCGDGDK